MGQRGHSKQGLGERPMAPGAEGTLSLVCLSPSSTSSVGRPPEASQLPPEARYGVDNGKARELNEWMVHGLLDFLVVLHMEASPLNN